MRNVLHLASWYPYEKDPYNGDFIQRQLIALSAIMPVTVIYLVKDRNLNKNDLKISIKNKTSNLEERIAFYGSVQTGISVIDQYFSYRRYKYLLKQLVRDYIREKGKPDLIHVHVVLHAGIVAMELCKELNLPYVVTEHSSVYQRTATENLWNRFFYFRWMSFRVLQKTELLITVSDHLAKQINALVKVKKTIVVTNIVDTRVFYYQLHEFTTPFRFIHVSGMTNAKNVEGILHAFAKLKEKRTDWKCRMVGPANESLFMLAKKLDIDSFIEWEGEVKYTQVASFMQQSHAHVLFSRYENQPCVNLEALCCGLPVIASRVGGIEEVVNNSNGILVEPLNEEALVLSMEKMIEEYKNFDRQTISEEAVNKYSYEVIGKLIADSYSKIRRP
jgi:glycosyltransferase involved in cell wall biosynthesis